MKMSDGKFVHGEGRVAAPDEGNGRPEDTFDSAFVNPDKRVLDPTLLNKTLLDRLPTPTGWRILIMTYQGREVTKGGIYVPDRTRDDYALATVTAYVLKVGPLCYRDTDRFGEVPWCRAKDWVLIGRYSGSRFKIDGGEVRIINDDEVIGTIFDPDDIHTV